MSFEHDVISSTNRYWYMYLYQSDGVTCIGAWSIDGNDIALTTCEIGLKKGTYYIKVEPYSYSSKTYTLKVNYTASAYYEKEFNDSPSTADTINPNTLYYGSIMDNGDPDWYVFEVKNKVEYVISFSHQIYSSSSKYWEIYAYKFDGVTSINGSYKKVPGNENVEFYLGVLEPGIYYIKIVPYSSSYWANSTYTVSVGEMKNGLCKAADGNWYYYVNNVVNTAYTGLANNAYGWWYVKNGKLDTSYTGMAKNQYGWWYVKKGKLDKSYTGMAKNQYGWWYMKNGKLDTSYTGMAKNQYGWWYMKNGKLDTSYTGMAKNQYGWWYMKNGKLDQTYTGMAKNQYGWWYLEKGTINFKYTGLAKNAYGTWYMKNGKLNTSFSGRVTIKGKNYTIKNGKVV